MTTYQCPQCVLRYPSMADLDDHLNHDHPGFKIGGTWQQAPFRAAPYRHPFALRRLDPRRTRSQGPEVGKREEQASGRS